MTMSKVGERVRKSFQNVLLAWSPVVTRTPAPRMRLSSTGLSRTYVAKLQSNKVYSYAARVPV